MKHNSGVHNIPIHAPNALVEKLTGGLRSATSKHLFTINTLM